MPEILTLFMPAPSADASSKSGSSTIAASDDAAGDSAGGSPFAEALRAHMQEATEAQRAPSRPETPAQPSATPAPSAAEGTDATDTGEMLALAVAAECTTAQQALSLPAVDQPEGDVPTVSTMQDTPLAVSQPIIMEAVHRLDTLIDQGVVEPKDLEDLSTSECEDLMLWLLAGAGGLFAPLALDTAPLTDAVSGAMQEDAFLTPSADAFELLAELMGNAKTDTAFLTDVSSLPDEAKAVLAQALAGLDTDAMASMSNEELAATLEQALADAGMTEPEGMLEALPKPILKALIRVFNHAEQAATARSMMAELSQRAAATGLQTLSVGKLSSMQTTEISGDEAPLQPVPPTPSTTTATTTTATTGTTANTTTMAATTTSAEGAGDALTDVTRPEQKDASPAPSVPESAETGIPDGAEPALGADPAYTVRSMDGETPTTLDPRAASVGPVADTHATGGTREAPQPYVDVQENIERLGAALRVSIRNNVTTAKIDLMPEELGRVQVTLSMRNGSLHGQIQTETPEAARMLTANVAQLRNTLTAQGVNLGDFDVSHGWDQSGSQAGQQFEDSRHGRRGHAHALPDEEPDADAIAALGAAQSSYNGLGHINTTA